MPETHFTIGMPQVEIEKSHTGSSATVLFGKLKKDQHLSCMRCGSARLRIKATVQRRLKHGTFGNRLVLLDLKVPKWYCRQCGRYFMQPIAGVRPRRRATEQFRLEVFHHHHGGLTQKYLSQTHRISTATVERWYQDFVRYRVKELEGRPLPKVLGIDEHFFTRKQGYATTLVDLRNHKVFDVVLGRDEATLGQYLRNLKGREQVQVVVMDLSESYRRIVQKYFSNAKIVADRFHVIRWVNHQFLKTWGDLKPEAKKDRGLLSLMRMHAWNLSEKRKIRLQEYLMANPDMRAIYEFKSGLVELLLHKRRNKRDVASLIPQLLWHIEECRRSPLIRFQQLAKTLKRWLEPIARMWRFTKNNGITEGLHNKMEMISRRAFGFRNFENYRLRVIALCGWDGVINRN